MIYLDHHAATPPCVEALAAMDRARERAWANPASVHSAGRASRALLEAARREVATALGAEPSDIVLTSGGTEACNLGVLGLGAATPRHVLTTSVEHPAVAAAVRALELRGARVTRIDVPDGIAPDAAAFEQMITDDTQLCAVQWVNHETGTVLPVEAWARVCSARSVPLFVDATQALGKVAVSVARLGATAVAAASHKMGGPAGAGALWVRRGTDVSPAILGGSQERGRRAGSPSVLAAVGFGAACAVVERRLSATGRVKVLRDRLEGALCAAGAVVNGAAGERVATVTDVSFAGVRGAELVAALDLEGVCASSGAACSSGLDEPSAVVRAMWPADAWRANGALRMSLGPDTTDDDVAVAAKAVELVLGRLRKT